jgi:hypothetical protein
MAAGTALQLAVKVIIQRQPPNGPLAPSAFGRCRATHCAAVSGCSWISLSMKCQKLRLSATGSGGCSGPRCAALGQQLTQLAPHQVGNRLSVGLTLEHHPLALQLLPQALEMRVGVALLRFAVPSP